MRRFLIITLISSFIGHGVSIARESADVPAERADADSELVITVWCRNGAFYRGPAVEYVPADHVTLRLSDGKHRRIDWANISSVDGVPGRAPRGQTEERRNHSTDMPPVQVEPVRVRMPAEKEFVANMPILPGNTPVHVRFTGMREGALIEFLSHSAEINGWGWPGGFVSGTADTWKELCALPCRVNADRDTSMRISGPNITTSRSFLLPTRGTRFEVEIKPGWDSTRTAAWVLLGIGIGLGATGVVVASTSTFNMADPTRTNLLIGGGSLLGAGIVLSIISAPVFSKSRTDVEIFVE